MYSMDSQINVSQPCLKTKEWDTALLQFHVISKERNTCAKSQPKQGAYMYRRNEYQTFVDKIGENIT